MTDDDVCKILGSCSDGLFRTEQDANGNCYVTFFDTKTRKTITLMGGSWDDLYSRAEAWAVIG